MRDQFENAKAAQQQAMFQAQAQARPQGYHPDVMANGAAVQPPQPALADACLNGFRGALMRVQEAESRVRTIADRLFGAVPQSGAQLGNVSAVPNSMAQEIDDVARQLNNALNQLNDSIDRLNV